MLRRSAKQIPKYRSAWSILTCLICGRKVHSEKVALPGVSRLSEEPAESRSCYPILSSRCESIGLRPSEWLMASF